MAERRWISGSRAARVFFTSHLIEFLDHHGKLPVRHPVILGSDLIAYSAAAKLRAAAAEEAQMLDQPNRCQTTLAARLYFRLWSNPRWRGDVQAASIRGRIATEPAGSNGFGYDPIFWTPEFRKTMGELEPDVKNRFSHRGRALARLKEFLSTL